MISETMVFRWLAIVQKRSSWFVMLAVFFLHALVVFQIFYQKILPPTDEIIVRSTVLGSPLFDLSQKASGEASQSQLRDEFYSNQALPPPVQPALDFPKQIDESKIDNPSTEAEHYFRFDELGSSAYPLSDFVIPTSAGVLTTINAKVEVYIGRDGVVQDVKVLLINVPNISDKLIAAIKGTEFKPATRNGFPVNSIKVMEIVIRI
ncbi:MAG: hypothetical protein K2X63_10330 [Burkholderiaceae bacterium]|nr:hypothetical protein [Burkholderiaceae bacterium]